MKQTITVPPEVLIDIMHAMLCGESLSYLQSRGAPITGTICKVRDVTHFNWWCSYNPDTLELMVTWEPKLRGV